MKKINITTKTPVSKILKYFRECEPNGYVNLKTKNGFIYLAGGILSKLENDKHFIVLEGRWIEV